MRKSRLLLLVLSGWVLGGGVCSAQLSSGLIACWSLDETSGNRADASANAYTLTDNGSTPSTTGVVGNAASFNGSTQYLSRAAGLLDGLSDFTIAYWAKINATGNQQGNTHGQGDSSSSTFFEFARHFVRGGSANQDNNFSEPYGTTFAFYVIRRSTTSVSMRKNDSTSVYSNSFGASGTVATAVTDGFQIGRVPAGSGGAASLMTGALDEFGIWNRSLSAAEETSLYNSGSGTACSTVAGGGGGSSTPSSGGLPLMGVGMVWFLALITGSLLLFASVKIGTAVEQAYFWWKDRRWHYANHRERETVKNLQAENQTRDELAVVRPKRCDRTPS